MVSKRGAGKLLGLLAVEKRWIKQKDLDTSLKIQEDSGGFIGAILMSEKLINQQQLDVLLAIQDDAEAREDDYLFGSIAVENKFITAEELMIALEQQKSNEFRKIIGEILIEKKCLTDEKRTAILKAQQRLKDKKASQEEKIAKSKCPKCEFSYKIRNPDRVRKVRCKKCGYIFEVGKELRATTSQLIKIQKDAGNVSSTNRFFEYLAENELIDEEQFKKLEKDGKGKRYCVGEEIARGGMGVILSTSDTNLRRNIVTKVHLNNDSRLATMRFIEEAQVTGQLEHPNIPPVYDLGLNKEKNLFFTMKHIKGETLECIIERLAIGDKKTEEKYPVTQIINIFLKVCDALKYSHDKRVLHRDIKPENIMIGEFGEVLLMDWGLAKIIGTKEDVEDLSSDELDKVSSVRNDDDFSQTIEGTTAGTPVYMPPEQALGFMDELDERSDLYSLGASLYYAISMQKPIVGNNLRDILEDAANGNIRPLPDHVPVELASIIRKAMEESPEDRYQSIEDFEDDLIKYQKGYSVSAKQDNIISMVKKLYKRNRLIFTLSSIISFFIIFGSILLMTLLSQQRNKAVEQKLRSEEALAKTASLLAKFNEEKIKRRLEHYQSAPSYFAQAELDIRNKKYNQAMKNINQAIKYDSLRTEYHCVRAGLYLHKKDYKNAMNGFKHCLKKKYNPRYTGAMVKLLRETKDKRNHPNTIKTLISYLIQLKLFGIAETYSRDIGTSFSIWSEKLRVKWSSGNYSFSINGNKKIRLNLQNNIGGKDLRLLKGMEISYLQLYLSNINSIEFTKDMKLESIRIYACPDIKDIELLSNQRLKSFIFESSQIKDLNFLKNSQLEHLNLNRCKITSLEPLRGQPIKKFELYFTPIEDLSILKTFKLEEFSYYVKFRKNLDFLKGTKIKKLTLNWSNVADISALKSTPIDTLYLYRSKIDFPKQIGELNLKELGYHSIKADSLNFVLKNRKLERFYFSPNKKFVPKDWGQILKRHPNKKLLLRDNFVGKNWLPIPVFAKEYKKKLAKK